MSIPSFDKSESEDVNADLQTQKTSKTTDSFEIISKNYWYHQRLEKEVTELYEFAEETKKNALIDPKPIVEIYRAEDVASRTEGLVGPVGVAKRLRELEKVEKLPKEKVVLQIAQEICEGKFGVKPLQELAEQALRTALSVQTEGITAAPLEGISKVEIKKNPDGTEYLAVYYAGPIRSAGGTAQGVSILIADHIRKALKLDRYKATEREVERMLEEVRAYNNIVHLQLPTSDEEIRVAWRNLPVMIQGDPTEKEEVSGFRNIESMGSNRIRGGACLVLNDGVVGRAKKLMKRIDKLGLDGYDWLNDIAKGKYSTFKSHKKEEDDETEEEVPELPYTPRYEAQADSSFLSDTLTGRPILAGATVPGGFRLRYGHARNTGISAYGVHPAVYGILDDYLVCGTHVRAERPGKGAILCPVDTLKPPIVKLDNGDVLEVHDYEMGKQLYPRVREILFMGDLLVGYGEFIQNNYPLVPPGYCEEWWVQELRREGADIYGDKEGIPLFEAAMNFPPTEEDAIKYSKKYKVPLHPRYTPAWKYITPEEFVKLRDIVKECEGEELPGEIKPILEKALILHTYRKRDDVVIPKFYETLKIQLGLNSNLPKNWSEYGDALYIVNEICEIEIRDTIGTTVGARMGRPEKSKARRLQPAQHGLFPVGDVKGIGNELRKADQVSSIRLKVGDRRCPNCSEHTLYVYCLRCKVKTIHMGTCTNRTCAAKMEEGPCDRCGHDVRYGIYRDVEIHKYVSEARKIVGDIPTSVKLIPEIKNDSMTPEFLGKAALRAKYDLHVFRDGTIRYDATDAPLTHFKPKEIGVPVDKLRELGYTVDIFNEPLVDENQILAILPQDIILNDSAKDHLMAVAHFIDDLLTSAYNTKPYYNINSYLDLVGHLVIGIAPHTSSGVIGRVIGFNKARVCWAHPFWHSAKRRNCDGDEDGIILVLDGLLNFSKDYLPSSRGSKMDTPLVLVTRLNPAEVDDEAFNLDAGEYYPLEFYTGALQGMNAKKFDGINKRIEAFLNSPRQFEHVPYTHSTSDMAEGGTVTKYKVLPTMVDKLNEQMHLAHIIRAVDEKFVAHQVISKHFIRDLMGNLRAFAAQGVYCPQCKSKYRRVPLSGKCTNPRCEARDKLRLNIYPASVSKYLESSLNLIKNYALDTYMRMRLDRIQLGIEGLWPKEEDKQMVLDDFLG